MPPTRYFDWAIRILYADLVWYEPGHVDLGYDYIFVAFTAVM